jgi:hypothetical protein
MSVEAAHEARHVPFDPATFRWPSVEPRPYKDGPASERGMGWRGVACHVLASSARGGAGFEQRYFEFAPGGW